ncbi:lachesin-like protein [Caerostris darwini]|uniref:Lachesin-like protein n=1 Tax=Caerostris darwini TaxID=1538125 RepID=A0AAV4UQ27_9ARAC|nr:lachesin-like protein [Caerostris darwini]
MNTHTLLAVHKHVLTRDKRIRVTNNNHQWKLHISEVQEKDRGFYMCQINTDPMISQTGYLDVTVPPTFIDTSTSSDTVVEERSKLSLRCEASGYPKPSVSWRREDKKVINLGLFRGRVYSELKVEGEYLNISQVSREHMTAYLCIASNGVPPAVSKRIVLQVNWEMLEEFYTYLLRCNSRNFIFHEKKHSINNMYLSEEPPTELTMCTAVAVESLD